MEHVSLAVNEKYLRDTVSIRNQHNSKHVPNKVFVA